MDPALEAFFSHFSAKQLVDIALARRDPEAAASLYMLTSYKEPMFVDAWKKEREVVGFAVDDLADVMEWLREEKMYAQADRIRTITGRLARLLGRNMDLPDNAVRNIAQTWPNQLTVKESVKILAAMEGKTKPTNPER